MKKRSKKYFEIGDIICCDDGGQNVDTWLVQDVFWEDKSWHYVCKLIINNINNIKKGV